MEVEITKEILCHYLFDLDTIDMGSNGIVNKIDDDTCIKIYYKDIYNTYASRDINWLDIEISQHLRVQKEIAEDTIGREVYGNEREKLRLLTKMGYINKVLYYRGYRIAVEMKYYKDYVELYDAISKLNKEKIKIVLKKIREELDKLISVNIFPADLSSNNILVNLDTLDVVIIDLDDVCTRYDSDKYLEEKPQVKKHLLYLCNRRYKQIKDAYEK